MLWLFVGTFTFRLSENLRFDWIRLGSFWECWRGITIIWRYYCRACFDSSFSHGRDRFCWLLCYAAWKWQYWGMYYFLKIWTCVSSKSNKYFKFHPLCLSVELNTCTVLLLTRLGKSFLTLCQVLHSTVIFQRNMQCVDSLPLIQSS